ncbi:MAG: hypothetical protein HY902_04645, partial [Deltaproteobacteria bacterium]|nr:hypothetical protein [Deltaproteobacteria bacterium]
MPRSPSVQIAHRRLWTLVLRVAVLFLGLQSIGLGHALSDIYSVASGAALHANADCPDDGPDTDCPPGCPTCHCSHAPVYSLPQPVL